MNRALVTLRANTEAMDGSIAKQDEPAMTGQLKSINDSLQAMQARLQGILNDNPGSAMEQRRADQGEDSDDENTPRVTGGKRRRKNKTAKKQRKTRRKTKKNRKQKGGYGYKTKQRKSAKDSGAESSIGRGGGRGIYKKSKKRRSTRS